jgi:hypothetical protein
VPPDEGYGPRGLDLDLNGVVWTVLSSGHLASFDRTKCKGPLNGAKAVTGKLCPEGWTLYRFPGPQFKDVTDPGSADHAYYVWVDRYGTLGLGPNVPIASTNGGESLLALADGKLREVVGAGRDDDAGQQHRELEVMDTRGLLHQVLASEIVAACLKHGHHSLRRRVPVNGVGVGYIARCIVFLHPSQPFAVFGRVLPLRIGGVLCRRSRK